MMAEITRYFYKNTSYTIHSENQIWCLKVKLVNKYSMKRISWQDQSRSGVDNAWPLVTGPDWCKINDSTRSMSFLDELLAKPKKVDRDKGRSQVWQWLPIKRDLIPYRLDDRRGRHKYKIQGVVLTDENSTHYNSWTRVYKHCVRYWQRVSESNI